MDQHVYTHDTGDYAGKLCKCNGCGTVERATFDFDFFVMAEDKEVPAPLYCERCMMKKAFGTPNPPTTTIRPNGEITHTGGDVLRNTGEKK